MQYVHVASKPKAKGIDYNHAIMAENKVALYSIIEGMRQYNFNTHTLNAALESIKYYTEKYVRPVDGKIFIDSGGYSIIQGAVHPNAVPRFVQCYNTMLRLIPGIFDKAFSLDIPWNKGFPEMNTRQKIMEFNDYALSTARDILLTNAVALERFSFVWHFKMLSQYEIWKTLYEKYEFNRIIRHRAIGGMVALRGDTGITFSPFIGMAYRCFLDYLDAGRFDQDFTLHFLGMYLPYDRFEMAILDGLFARYLEGEAQIVTTYDSINPLQSTRKGKDIPLFEFTGTELAVYDNLVDAPAGILELAYGEPDLIRFVQEEIARRRAGQRLKSADSFGPLSIYSHREVNHFFEYVVAAHGLAEVFFQEWSLTKINGHFADVLGTLAKAYPALFTPHLRASIMRNVAITYEFHRWFIDDRSRSGLDTLIRANIRKIGFPGRLD
uniref:Uncharacterized protein n=1 Tax=Desulfovibrio sp. U5L TaxID=596152 RepID=I2Q4H0_9BACT